MPHVSVACWYKPCWFLLCFRGFKVTTTAGSVISSDRSECTTNKRGDGTTKRIAPLVGTTTTDVLLYQVYLLLCTVPAVYQYSKQPKRFLLGIFLEREKRKYPGFPIKNWPQIITIISLLAFLLLSYLICTNQMKRSPSKWKIYYSCTRTPLQLILHDYIRIQTYSSSI